MLYTYSNTLQRSALQGYWGRSYQNRAEHNTSTRESIGLVMTTTTIIEIVAKYFSAAA